jgi:hypothetical protein
MKKPFSKILAKPFIAFLPFLFCYTSFSQCSNSGARGATIFEDDNNIGAIAFGVPGNAGLSDNIFASASAIVSLFSGNTHYLRSTGYGFSLPSTAAICGILVEVEKHATGINILANVTDNDIRLVKAGLLVGSNHASGSTWPGSQSYYSYGGPTDLWGTTWTYADINSPGFGASFSAQINGLIAVFPSAHIDHIRITVYFNIILPVRLETFTAQAIDDHKAQLNWISTGNDDRTRLYVQRKTIAHDWKTIYSTNTGVSSSKSTGYIDSECDEPEAYYRLQLQDGNGHATYSDILFVKWREQDAFTVYPNPAKNEIYVQYAGNIKQVSCTSVDGRRWMINHQQSSSGLIKLNIQHLPAGLYIINMNGRKRVVIKN